ncbi:MAG: response regulator [Desulfobacteraceae bacterium]
MLTILVIDDEKPTLSMFKLFLSAYGYTVFTAENGEDGLAIFREKRPDIVFTDLKMPGMDGLEVLAKIHSSGITTQVVMITGHGDIDKAVAALNLDAADFINKPVEREALDAALLRAESRMDARGAQPFELASRIEEKIFHLEIRGRISRHCEQPFAEVIGEIPVDECSEVIITFHENFTITRNGLSCLNGFLNQIRPLCSHITLDNLSFNFKRIFEMVGLTRYAKVAS